MWGRVRIVRSSVIYVHSATRDVCHLKVDTGEGPSSAKS